MKIRFMCLRHYCDVNIDGNHAVAGKKHLVQTAIVLDNGDGTYEFDTSNMYCPEYDSLTQNEIAHLRDLNFAERNKAVQDIYDKHICSDTWTVVLYSNFTPIGEPKKEN